MQGEKFGEKGFTLLEAIVALGFFALLACAALSIFRLGVCCFDYSDEKAAVQYELRTAQDMVMQDIRESQLLKDCPVMIVNDRKMVIEKWEEVNGSSTKVKITYMLNGEGQLVRQVNRLDNGSLVSVMPVTDIKVAPQFEKDLSSGFYILRLQGFDSRGQRVVQTVETGLGRRLE